MVHLHLLWLLIQRDIKVRYKAPWLGVVWAFAVPLAVSLVLMVVFGHVLPIFDTPGTFFLFVVTAMFPWNFLQLSVSTATTSIQDNAEMVQKVRFPRITLPLAVVGAHGFNFLCALLVLSLFVGMANGFTGWIVLLPVVVGLQVLFTVGVVLLVSSLQVAFRDVRYLVEVGLWLWFYLTPVFYPMALVSRVPENIFFRLYTMNPMVSFVSLFRVVLLGPDNAGMVGGMSVAWCLAMATLGTALVLVCGLITFRGREPVFADLVQ